MSRDPLKENQVIWEICDSSSDYQLGLQYANIGYGLKGSIGPIT